MRIAQIARGSHMPGLVRYGHKWLDLGALWAHSYFPFESAIGELLKLFHDSQGIEKQVMYVCVILLACFHFKVVSHINMLQTLPHIAESTYQSDTAKENFYQQLYTQARSLYRWRL